MQDSLNDACEQLIYFTTSRFATPGPTAEKKCVKYEVTLSYVLGNVRVRVEPEDLRMGDIRHLIEEVYKAFMRVTVIRELVEIVRGKSVVFIVHHVCVVVVLQNGHH